MWVMVDVEADGQCPGLFSMISFGAVIVDKEGKLDDTFFGQCAPISDMWQEEALKVSGYTREETLKFRDAQETMVLFDMWLSEMSTKHGRKPCFISDNNGFDWQFINYYFHRMINENPFGHSSTNLGSLYKGMKKHMGKQWKKLRKTKHTHHPVDDAKGNAEALLHMINEMGLNMKL